MPPKANLKKSSQSLAARGMPLNSKSSKRIPLKEKKNKVKENDDTADRVESVQNGLDRCASLLAVMLDSPQNSQPEKEHEAAATNKKNTAKLKKTSELKKENLSQNLKTAYNRRLVSSTPLLNASNEEAPTVEENDTVEELIQERDKLQNYLKQITQDKNKVKVEYNAILQQQIDSPVKNQCLPQDRQRLQKPLIGYQSPKNKHVDDIYQYKNVKSNFVNNLSETEKRQRKLKVTPQSAEHSYQSRSDTTTNGNNLSTVTPKHNERNLIELSNLMASITKKLTLEKDKRNTPPIEPFSMDTSFPSTNTAINFSACRHYDATEGEPATSPQIDDNGNYTKDEQRIRNATVDGGNFYDVTESDSKLIKVTNKNNTENHIILRDDIAADKVMEDKNFTGEVISPNGEVISPCRHHCCCIQIDSKKSVIDETSPRTINEPSLKLKYVATENASKQTNGDDFTVSNIQLTTLNYLLKELHVLLGEKGDLEVNRLLTEIDHTVGMLPFTMNNLPIDVQTEINFALQPLRVDNADLRRKLRLANQKTKELNIRLTQQKKNDDSVMRKIEELQSKLTIEENTKKLLAGEIADVCKVTEELQNENQKILHSMSEKELKYIEDHQNWLNEKSKLMQEVSQYQSQLENLKICEKAHEKELKIFEVSGKQKDAEIDRLSKLNRGLQDSVTSLISDIENERHEKSKRNPITRAQSTSITKSLERCFNSRKACDKQPDTSPEQSTMASSTTDSTMKQNLLSSTTFLSSKFDSMYSGTDTLSTLATYDNSAFQKDMEHLDAEIHRIQKSLKQKAK